MQRRNLLMKRPSSGFAFGNALDFTNDVNNNVTFTTVNASADFVFSIWFKPNSFSFNNICRNASTYIQIRSATLIRVKRSLNNDFTVPTMSAGNWYNLVVERTGSSMKLYLNSVASATLSSESGIISFNTLGYNSGLCDMVQDEFGFKTSVGATQSNVDDLYNLGVGSSFNSIFPTPEIHCNMNESGTDTIMINNGSGSNGALNNFTSGMWVAH